MAHYNQRHKSLESTVFQAILRIKGAYSCSSSGVCFSKAFFGPGGKGERSWNLNTRDDGNVYFVSQIQASTYDNKPGSTNICMLIRQDWLEKVGMQTPKTADEFYQALKAFQEKDANGNGEKDEVMSLDPTKFDASLTQWFGLVYNLVNFTIDDGKPSDITSPWHQPGIKPYFQFMKKLHDEGLLDPAAIGSDTPNQNIENNRASAIASYCMATWNEANVAGAEDPRYMPIPLVTADASITPIIATEPPALSYSRWSFTKDAKNEEANARLIDLLCSDTYMELTQWGIKGDSYEIDKDGNKQLLPIALHNAYDEAYDKGIVIGDYLWANDSMFPKRRFVPMENEINVVPEYKAKAQVDVINYGHTTPIGTSNYLPVATIDEAQRRLELATDLETRSRELAANLILGNESIDDLDKHVAELDELGLPELIKIDQERLNRAKKLGLFD